jgi:2-dehydro-3-deoxygalactonokinase
MIELPYKEIPFSIKEPDLNVKKIEPTDKFKHSTLIISGVKTIDDVMRGEETQLIGCLNEPDKEKHLFIFPGTHSKHVIIKDQSIADIKTYMTGEFFELLSAKSILSSSLERGKGLEEEANRKSFEEGVIAGSQSNLLHNSFLVRTNHLFKRLTKEENYYYLSGLIIGTELGELMTNNNSISLVASGEMQELYEIALKLRLKTDMNHFRIEDADQALIKGQLRIAKHFDGYL